MGAKNVSNMRCKRKIRHALHTGRIFPAKGDDRLEQWRYPSCAPRILTSSRASVDKFLKRLIWRFIYFFKQTSDVLLKINAELL
jgi:hypothetical protein